MSDTISPCISPPVAPEDIRTTINNVLEQGDYLIDYRQETEEPFLIKNPLHDIMQALQEFLQSAFSVIGDVFGAIRSLSSVLYWVVVVLCVAFVLFVAYSMTRYVYRHVVRRMKKGKDKATTEEEDDILTWEKRARNASGEGDYVLALRCLLKAAFIYLEENDERSFKPAYTNREYLRRYDGKKVHGHLSVIVETAEGWYGGLRCGEEDYRKAWHAYSLLPEAHMPRARGTDA